jgi:DNA modification methylase
MSESRPRRPTATARFGSSRRESHDATGFYERFVAPEISPDATLARTDKLDVIYCHDARGMEQVESGSVALVVTSPPYFAGKEYEASLGENGVPGSYFEYLTLLRDVFAECKRVLEPGGRIGVNVANLGRRPYRSLAGDVTTILQDLGLLLRGEIIWWKGRAAGGSCAWGTFQRPTNPVLRDVTERIVIASKGRFDRAVKPDARAQAGLPSTTTISRDEFLEATTDLWELAPESASRVGHPAPFPVALPTRLIELYTFEDDVVLDPFMGSGSTAVAAVRTGRHYIGYDTDAGYVEAAERRVKTEEAALHRAPPPARVRVPATHPTAEPSGDALDTAVASGDALDAAIAEGRQVKTVARLLLETCELTAIEADVKLPGAGLVLSFAAVDPMGRPWAFDLTGGFTTSRPGLRRNDVLWRAIGRAAVHHQHRPDVPYVLLTTDAPARTGPGAAALALTKRGGAITDVVVITDKQDIQRLRNRAITK